MQGMNKTFTFRTGLHFTMLWCNQQSSFSEIHTSLVTYYNTTIVMPLVTVCCNSLCQMKPRFHLTPLHESPTTARSKSMAPVWIPLWEGQMSEGMKGGKKCFSLCRLTDEREVVLGGMRVEGAERGVSEEVWGSWVQRFICSPSSECIYRTRNDLKITWSKVDKIY